MEQCGVYLKFGSLNGNMQDIGKLSRFELSPQSSLFHWWFSGDTSGGGATIAVDWQPPQCWEASSAQTRRNRCSHHCSCLPQQTLRWSHWKWETLMLESIDSSWEWFLVRMRLTRMMLGFSLFCAASSKVDHCLPQLLLAYAPVVVVVEHPDNQIVIKQSTNQPHWQQDWIVVSQFLIE